jgi:hypothetical protein
MNTITNFEDLSFEEMGSKIFDLYAKIQKNLAQRYRTFVYAIFKIWIKITEIYPYFYTFTHKSMLPAEI